MTGQACMHRCGVMTSLLTSLARSAYLQPFASSWTVTQYRDVGDKFEILSGDVILIEKTSSSKQDSCHRMHDGYLLILCRPAHGLGHILTSHHLLHTLPQLCGMDFPQPGFSFVHLQATTELQPAPAHTARAHTFWCARGSQAGRSKACGSCGCNLDACGCFWPFLEAEHAENCCKATQTLQ